MDKVRLGIIGIGNMGTDHAVSTDAGNIKGMELTAVCDIDSDRRQWCKENLSDKVQIFDDYKTMYASGIIDAVLIAVPHYFHPQMAIDAFSANLHVLTEKPAGVYTNQVVEMNDAAKKSDKKFAIMFNQRTNPTFRKVKELVESGELGAIKRVQWTVTMWYRCQAYHDSSSWRSTWEGEGGGVVINQAPHNIDLYQWMFGMPKSVRAEVGFGRYYNIEVDDDVTAYFDHGDFSGTFITSTGECPGCNILEVSCDMGRLVVTDRWDLKFERNRKSEREYNANTQGVFGVPEHWSVNIPIEDEETSHNGILQNFTNAILYDEELIAPGEEGLNQLTLSNAILLSGWTKEKVELPIDGDRFYSMLQDKIKSSTYVKTVRKQLGDVNQSGGKK